MNAANLTATTSSLSLTTSSTSFALTLGFAALVLIITADVLESTSQRKRLGNQFTIVGDASYVRRRLKRAEVDRNIHGLFKRGYENVGLAHFLKYLHHTDTETSMLAQLSKFGKPWAFWGQHDDFVVVMTPETCDEIKNVDPSKLSFLQAIEDVCDPSRTPI